MVLAHLVSLLLLMLMQSQQPMPIVRIAGQSLRLATKLHGTSASFSLWCFEFQFETKHCFHFARVPGGVCDNPTKMSGARLNNKPHLDDDIKPKD